MTAQPSVRWSAILTGTVVVLGNRVDSPPLSTARRKWKAVTGIHFRRPRGPKGRGCRASRARYSALPAIPYAGTEGAHGGR
jgi:hypothetical protein